MSDANGAVSAGVFYELKDAANGARSSLTVTADSEWMNAESRAFPVTIDPQIVVNGSGSMTTYSWNDGKLYNSSPPYGRGPAAPATGAARQAVGI